MRLRLYQVDAFTDHLFGGNPAAVCPLDEWLDDRILQRIALENNLSETTFFTGGDGVYELRWFTPTTEVDLCGHATLAAAFVLFTELGETAPRIRFDSRSGPLYAERDGEGRGAEERASWDGIVTLDFPLMEGTPLDDVPPALIEGLGAPPGARAVAWFKTPAATNYYAVFEREAEVRALRPRFDLLQELHPYGVVATAPGDSADCASRYFAPSYGIPEDPVTGSIHAGLAPYWANRLGRPRVHAHQVSGRGGELFCEVRGDRVRIAGGAVKYLEGTVSVWESADEGR